MAPNVPFLILFAVKWQWFSKHIACNTLSFREGIKLIFIGNTVKTALIHKANGERQCCVWLTAESAGSQRNSVNRLALATRASQGTDRQTESVLLATALRHNHTIWHLKCTVWNKVLLTFTGTWWSCWTCHSWLSQQLSHYMKRRPHPQHSGFISCLKGLPILTANILHSVSASTRQRLIIQNTCTQLRLTLLQPKLPHPPRQCKRRLSEKSLLLTIDPSVFLLKQWNLVVCGCTRNTCAVGEGEILQRSLKL